MATVQTVLIVDDDPIIQKIYTGVFAGAGFVVEFAGDGEAAIAFLKNSTPDLVLLDLFLPKVNGVEVLKYIRVGRANRTLPVIVFTSAYNSRYVKQSWDLGATTCVAKNHFEPARILELVRTTLAKVRPPVETSSDGAAADFPAGGDASTPGSDSSPAAAARTSIEGLRQKLAESFPSVRAELRSRLQTLVNSEGDSSRLPKLAEVQRVVQALTKQASGAGLIKLVCLSRVVGDLLGELGNQPSGINPCSLRTIGQAVDLIGVLFDQAVTTLTEPPAPGLMLIAAKQVSSLELMAPLKKANLVSISVQELSAAVDLLEQNRFHLVLLDQETPELKGPELSSMVRSFPANKRTHVIFVTRLDDYEIQVRSDMSGANDLIARPVRLAELAVKALTHLLREQVGVAAA